MSYIKRLKLQGFKSFANPTILTYEKDFNTIVGANGSGKSNVFDALCFVLGRMSSKGLRADKLGNLVFNGGKNLKPSKEAEVSIYLSNENKELLDGEFEEVKISRIVKNTGQSQYLLNNNKVTRTEIVEVLKRAQIDPDGYNIILQGDIMRIVNMTSVERRELIEEISNISGYEEQRQKSLKKLEKVETDLKEADLLMEEKTKYIKELKSEKEQAEKYHKVKDELRFKSLLLTKAKIIRNQSLKEKKEESLAKLEEDHKDFKEKLTIFEAKTRDINDEITKIEKEIEIKSHNDFISVTNKITSLESELQNLKEKKAEYKKQVQEIKSKSEGISADIKNNKSKISKLDQEKKDLESKKKEVEDNLTKLEINLNSLRKGISSDSFKELDEIDRQIDELNDQKFNKNHIKHDNSIQVEKLNTKLEHLQGDIHKIEESNSENEDQIKQLDSYRSKLKDLIVKISTKTNQNAETSAKLNNLQKEYSEVIEDHSRLRMKADASRELMSTNKAVDTMTKLQGKDNQIHGTVASLASVPEKYSMALETLSGKALFNIVVESDQTAVKYINYLKQNKIGNATFLPLNKVNAKYRLDDTVLNKKGVIDYALNLIKFDPMYENIFHLIFGNAIVIEKIEDAKGIGIGDYRMVTLDGDIVAKTGAMSGGFKSRKKGLGAFKDDKVLEKLEKIEVRVNSLKSTIDILKEEKEDSEKEIYDLRQEKIEVESEVAKLEKILSIEGKDTDSIKKEIEDIISDKTIIEGSLNKIERDIKAIEEEIEILNKRKLELKASSTGHLSIMDSINEIEDTRNKIKDKLSELKSSIDNKNIQIENVLKPELNNLDKILVEGEESLKRTDELVQKLTNRILEIDLQLKEYKKRESELSKDYKGFIEKRDKLKEDKAKLEVKFEKEITKFDSVKEKMAQLRYAISEFESLNKTLEEDLEILYNQVKAEFISENSEDETGDIALGQVNALIESIDESLKTKPIDVKELQTRVNNLKTKLNSFGSINMKAVEIYDKLKEEFDSLLEKRETLNKDKAEILEFIAEMDGKKKERFVETFNQLREHFIRIFNKLSTKGEAELNLENEDDIFNTGVEIRVKLSKNNYLDIKSLSGGEKTITAIAFIFAVQEFNPASFYIFDEVDAALDIMNCEKLGKLIKESSHKAQYIVVSHSEHLIQSSDTIYGVTMDANKISGVVSLDLKNMAEYLDENEAKTAKS